MHTVSYVIYLDNYSKLRLFKNLTLILYLIDIYNIYSTFRQQSWVKVQI